MRIRVGLLLIGFICEAATEKINELEKRYINPEVGAEIAYTEFRLQVLLDSYAEDRMIYSCADDDVKQWCKKKIDGDSPVMHEIMETAFEKWNKYKSETVD